MSTFLKVNDRVRHINENIDKSLGVMTIIEIKGGSAFCMGLDYKDFGSKRGTFLLSDLKLAEQ